MKSLLLFSFLLLMLCPLCALSYTPDATFSLGGNFTYYSKEVDYYDNFRPTLDFSIEINPIAITIENSRRISFPFGMEYLTRSPVENRRFLQERIRFYALLDYQILPTRYFAFSFSPGLGYTYFPNINAGSLFLTFETGPILTLGNHFSISLPFKFIAARSDLEVQISIACSVYPLGLKEGKR